MNDQFGQVVKIPNTADEPFRNMMGDIDAMKIVSQGAMNAIRDSLHKVKEE